VTRSPQGRVLDAASPQGQHHQDDDHDQQQSAESDFHAASRTQLAPAERGLTRTRHDRPPIDTVSAPRPAWLASTKEAFAAYWADQVASLATPSVGALVVRYFDLMDEHARALRDVRKQRHTTGSTGQKVMNPSAGYLLQLEGAMQKLEQSLGISPQARTRMKFEAASTEATLDRLLGRARGEDR
jgi:phage terminase small subunit